MGFSARSIEAVLLGFLTLLPAPAVAAPVSPTVPATVLHRQYRLRFLQIHTGEKLDVVYRNGDSYVANALADLDYFLRDYRNGEVHHYNPRLFDLLYQLLEAAGRPDAWINVVCGYRNPQTNSYLRSHGHAVAEHSLHMQAMAIDIRLPGIGTAKLRDLALALHEGGVGYYPGSDFIHVDVGRVRRW
jgi:uncharacterized protein YcbK (DUF882 family)